MTYDVVNPSKGWMVSNDLVQVVLIIGVLASLGQCQIIYEELYQRMFAGNLLGNWIY